MGRASTARRIAAAAAYGGTGLGLLGASAYGVLVAEAKWAKRVIGLPTGEPPDSNGTYLPSSGQATGDRLNYVVMGDSTAAGLGAESPEDTPGALTAAGLAELSGRPVDLTVVALVGATSRSMLDQLDGALAADPQVVLIMVGANDVTHKIRPAESCRDLSQVVTRLRECGAEVVVGTCPDLGTVKPIPHPLRFVARQWSRSLATAQSVAVVNAGGRSVSLADILGPEFALAGEEWFSPDGYHPSRSGYAAAAAALLPTLARALEVHDGDDDIATEPPTRYGYLPVAVAAAQAATRPGAEVAPVQVGGRDAGPSGRWAQVRLRGRALLPRVTRGEPDGEALEAGVVDESELVAGDVPPDDPTEAPDASVAGESLVQADAIRQAQPMP